MALMKRILVGRPLATTEQEHQRLSKKVGLAVFSSDAISSSAYATEEILFVTALGASSLALGLDTLIPIAIVVAVLLTIVVASYRQTIMAYPSGGGAYIVSRENLGENPSLIAGASLLVDYILTVAVSISAGVAAIISIPEFRGVRDDRVLFCIGLIVFIALVNLRGVKESGRLFALPTYIYILSLGGLIVYGLLRAYVFDDISRVPIDHEAFEGLATGGSLSVFLILKGFSSGAVALTGTEAISNGVPAFRRPEARNAAATLTWMGLILGSLFFGVSVLATELHPYPSEHQTAIAQMGLQVFGNGAMFLILQIFTALILVLAANTAFADFPRLSSIIARDGYLPRQLANRGDRLVYSNGVIVLAAGAAVLVVAFGGLTNALIPLYAVGVFTSFTLSQVGMVRHHRRVREPGWKRKAVINGIGATGTAVVLVIVAGTKFTSGAWVSVVVITLIILLFKGIHSHYQRVARSLRVTPGYRPRPWNNTVIVLVGRVHTGVLNAIAYAKALNPSHLIAVSVVSDEEEDEFIREQWEQFRIAVPLETVYNPYREMTRPILEFIDEIDKQWSNDVITVVIPEFVVRRWWEHLLHNQSALFLKGRLLFRKGTVVTSVPYHVE